VSPDRLRLAVIGAGSIVPVHLRAFERLGRTTVVGVASRTAERAAAVTSRFGGEPFTDPERLLDAARPDAVLVAVPPFRAPALTDLVVTRALPLLLEKPLAATDAAPLPSLAERIERSGLVVAVGYHLRGLEPLAEVRARLDARPPALVVGRWLDRTVGGDWWGSAARGGGQVVEQATHLFDLGRVLAGEATVVGATAASARSRDDASPAGELAGATAAVLRFDSGAVGMFAATRVLETARVALEVAAPGLLVTVRRTEAAPAAGWAVTVDEGRGEVGLPAGRDPYEVQDEAFLRAIETGRPGAVLCTYADALATDRLTRAVVAAAGGHA
jgi:myo-inositol 2-dehydrogenase / D-chiro-inositol 1-dehydrogenase